MEEGLNVFSIKDLENFSGIKAHTIRIWEKRYSILEPDRTDSNIRTYNEAELKKILNRYKFVKTSGLPRFCGGLVGFFGYDMVRFFEE